MTPRFDILAFGMPGWQELLLIAVIGLLIFGKRLPEVGKSLGKSIVEFKKGLRGIEDDIDKAVDESSQADMLPPPQQSPPPAQTTESQTSAQEKEGVS